MSAFQAKPGVAALVSLLAAAAMAGGCGDDGAVPAPVLPPLAEGQVDPGPPSAIKASSTPSQRVELPGPRSAINASLKAAPEKKRGGPR